jgi:predicted DNA-binding transcriptional regulator YafY
LTDRADGSLLMKMTLNNLDEVEKWVLGFGEHATVIEPKELRERIEKTAGKIQQKY